MAHPDDRECLQGDTLFRVELSDSAEGPPRWAEVRHTRFKYPYLLRWPPRDGEPAEEPLWAVATNLLVRMEPGIDPGEAEAVLRDLASQGAPDAIIRVEGLPLPHTYLVERHSPADFDRGEPDFLAARRMSFVGRNGVAAANLDYLVFSFPTVRAAPLPPSSRDSELERLGVIEAHAAGVVGSHQVRVAVLDTGVDTRHEDLAANICHVQGRVLGYDFYRDRSEVVDGNGHGTYCAGLIGGRGYGVNQQVSILPVRFMSSSGCATTALAIKGIGFALDHGARVISSSWGGVADSSDLEAMIARADGEEVLFVAGAGNGRRNLDTDDYYPASYQQYSMITVGGALDSDQPASKWGYGRKRVHLSAPGESVPSTYHNPRHGEIWLSGTSVSTAFVAGACALVMAAHPDWTHTQVRERIIQSVRPMQSGTIQPQAACCAGGRLDVYNAVSGSDLNRSLRCPGVSP